MSFPEHIFGDKFVTEVFREALSTLNSFGINPSGKELDSILALIKAFYEGLCKKLPRRFFLNSLPPGVGKTQIIASFIRVWKRFGFLPAGGILIGLQTKDEIAGLIKRLDMDRAEVGVFTRDDDINALGADDPLAAPILITTQQMLIKRMKDRSFGAARDFHYLGEPRALRIWDESFTLAEPIVLELFALQQLPYWLRRKFPMLADAVQGLANDLQRADEGALLHIPGSFADDLPGVRRALIDGDIHLGPDAKRTIDALDMAAGRSLLIRAGGGAHNRVLIGASRPLPADLAPLIITDASGRVRHTYRLMESVIGDLVRLPSSVTDYRNVQLHIWQQASGREILADHAESWIIYRVVAEEMEQRPGRWLVISYKPKGKLDVQAALTDALGGRVPFDYLEWGKHHGTNAFKDVQNVMVIGSYFYPDLAYDALGIAATGLPADEMPELKTRAIREGEFQHNMYQAILRGSARKSNNGVASPCNVFVVASPKNRAVALLEEAFPGAEIERWGPVRDNTPTTREQAIMDALGALLPVGGQEVSKKAVREAAGIATSHELARQLRRSILVSYLRKEGIGTTTRGFVRQA